MKKESAGKVPSPEPKHLKSILFNADFVSYRGLITKIASTIYQQKEGWIVCVSKFEGIYFMCEFCTAKKELEIASW